MTLAEQIASVLGVAPAHAQRVVTALVEDPEPTLTALQLAGVLKSTETVDYSIAVVDETGELAHHHRGPLDVLTVEILSNGERYPHGAAIYARTTHTLHRAEKGEWERVTL